MVQDEAAGAHAKTRTAWLAVALITAVAGLLRAWRIGEAGLWLDEALTWSLGRQSAAVLLSGHADLANPPLYYLLMKGWMGLFGTSEAALRSLSALAGTLSVPVVYVVGRDLLGRRAGLLAALLLATSPLHLAYSQEARTYALVVLLGLLATWLFLRAVRTDAWAGWAGAAVVGALAFYCHYSAGLLLAFLAGYALWQARRPRALAAGGLLGALCLPGMVLYLVPGLLGPAGFAYWQPYFTLAALAKLANSVFGRPVSPESPLALKGVAGLLLLAAVAIPLWHAARATRFVPPDDRRSLLFALLWLAAPILLFAAMARVKPVWQERYVLVALPAYFILTAWALLRAQARPRAILATSLALLAGWGLADFLVGPRSDGWRAAVAGVERLAAATGDANAAILLTPPFARLPFDYYYRGPLPRLGFPTIHTASPGAPESLGVGRAEAQASTARRTTLFVIHWDRDDADPELRLVRTAAAARGASILRRVDELRVFIIGRGAEALAGAPT